MKKKLLLIFWLICVFMVAAVIFAPAQILNEVVSKYTRNTFAVLDSKGSLWNGSGELISKVSANGVPLRIAPLSWKVNMSELTKGRPTLNIKNGNKVSAISYQGDWKFNINSLPVPIALIDNFLPQDMLATWRDLKAGGLLQIKQMTGTFSDNQPDIKATLEWDQASLAIFPLSPIGSYQITMNFIGTNADFNFDTQKGPLTISGGGKLTQRKLDAELTMTPSEETAAIFTPTLRFWGQPISNNSYRFSLKNLSN